MKVGVSGFEPGLMDVADFFEIDAHDSDSLKTALRKKALISLSANHFYFTHSDAEVFQDRIELLSESANASGAFYCLLKLPPSFFERYTLEQKIAQFLKIWNRFSSVPVVIDLPRNVQKFSQKGYEFANDPLWAPIKKSKCWKIHGWHDARWVRMYSEQDLVALKKKTAKFKPEYLIFGHSQRTIQIRQFLALDY